ncbi:hypothetical protein MJD09_15135 [bacterium]|nr:hypothetical protein [bacterium]
MKVTHSSILAIFLAVPSFACVPFPLVELDSSSREAIERFVDNHYSEVSSKTEIRHLDAFGFERASSVNIEFRPHRSGDGIDYYFTLSCRSDSAENWSCGELREKRSIHVQNPDDDIDIGVRIDAPTARKIVESIRGEILVNADGFYRYSESKIEKTSVLALDLEHIELIDEDRYLITSGSWAPCSRHEIEVQKIPCGLEYCSFIVLRNEVKHFL